MSWTLDDYSTYGAKIVSATGRKATHTLDAIVHALAPAVRAHTTDTHGYTDIVFALFDLLGVRFIPVCATCPTNACTASARSPPTSRSMP